MSPPNTQASNGPKKHGTPRGGRPTGRSKRKPPIKLDAEAKARMQELMETECLRKAIARRIATGEMNYQEFTMRYPSEYAVSYRAKNLLLQNPKMTRARAFWLAEDPKRIEAMRNKQIRTFATYTGLSYEISRDIAAGKTSLAALSKQDERWAFIWKRAKQRIKDSKAKGRNVTPIEAIRWARGDFGLPFDPEENPADIEDRGNEIHELYPFMKKRHTRRMARFDLDLDGLAKVAPANCGWGPRAFELWERDKNLHRKFIRLMAMMNLNDEEVASFIERTEPARKKYAELAEFDRAFFFQLYGSEVSAQFLPDNNPFAWTLDPLEGGEPLKQSKLQVLFFCPNDAHNAVFSQSETDEDVVARKLSAALAAGDRLDIEVINEHLERALKSDRSLSITLRNGLVFTGKPAWHSPFEVQLSLPNNAWIMILYHSILKIEAQGR